MNESYLNSGRNTVLLSKPSKAICLLLMVFFVCSRPLVSFGQTSTWNDSADPNTNPPTNTSLKSTSQTSRNLVSKASTLATIIPNKVDETCPASNDGSISPVLSNGLTNIRYVKLTQQYADNQQIEEIQAFEIFTGTNVALATNGATATASSTVYNNISAFGPQRAIDGNLGNSLWHSADNDKVGAYIIIDLVSAKNIDYLRIYNRIDCCWDRGQNMLLELFDGSNNLVYTKAVNLWGGVNGLHYIDVNVLDVSWSDGPTTLNRTGLDSGTYALNYADAGGYSTSTPIIIGTKYVAPTIDAITQPICNVPSGSVELSGLPVSGTLFQTGTVSGSYLITGSTMTITGLAAGTYNFTVSNGTCTSSATGDVTIGSISTKTWNGTTWAPSVPTSSDLAIINGNYSASCNGDINACSLVINSGYTLTIEAGQFVTIQNDLTINGTLDVLDHGSLVMVNDAGVVTNNGSGRVHRFTTPFKMHDYTYWSTPVTSTNIATTFLGWRTNYAYEYDANIDDWKCASTMTPAKGVIVMVPNPVSGPEENPSEVIFCGAVNNGVQKVTGVIPERSYLVGNPYPSAICADKFLTQNAGVIEGTLYFWTHNTAIQLRSNITNGTAGSGTYAFTSDDYASYNLVGGVGTMATSGGVKPTGKIASCQGFFATSNATITGATEIVFNNSMRLCSGGTVLNNSQFFKTKKVEETIAVKKNRVWLNMTNTEGAFKQTLIGYVTDATNNYDSRFDGESFDANEFIDFYSINQDKNLVIQGRALPFDENDEVPLGYRTTIDGAFAIKIDQVDGALAHQAVFLEDKLTNTVFDLKNGNYTFNTDKGTFNDRFVLKYKSVDKTLETNDLYVQANKVLVSVANKQIKINSFAQTIDKVVINDISGKQIYQKSKVGNSELLITDFVSSGQTLIVKTSLQNGNIVTDKIIY